MDRSKKEILILSLSKDEATRPFYREWARTIHANPDMPYPTESASSAIVLWRAVTEAARS